MKIVDNVNYNALKEKDYNFICDNCKEKTEWFIGWNSYFFEKKRFCSWNCKRKYMRSNPPTKKQQEMIDKYAKRGIEFQGTNILEAEEFIESRQIH